MAINQRVFKKIRMGYIPDNLQERKKMNTIIRLIIAALIFWIIYYFLIPLLPGNAQTFFGVLVVIAAIIFLLGEVGGYWPWKKE